MDNGDGDGDGDGDWTQEWSHRRGSMCKSGDDERNVRGDRWKIEGE